MSEISTAIIYEGILSISALILYFYVEPKYNKTDSTSFLNSKRIFAIVISIPFMEFLVGFLLQSSDCLYPSSFDGITPKINEYCVGTPDLLKHSLFYDLFYLRVNDAFNGAHWIDYMMIPILYFVTYRLTHDSFFSALNAAFMVFIHESLWFVFYWVQYYQVFRTEGWANDFAFFMLVCTLGYIGITKYRKYYLNVFFVFGTCIYICFLMVWSTFGFHVTVINNTALGDATHYLVTQWYNDAQTNAFEVFSWSLVFIVFLLNVWINRGFVLEEKETDKQEVINSSKN